MDDFFSWGYLRCLVYATSVHDVAELQQHVENACETITGKAGIDNYDNL
jgi:hypothetical protein